MEAKGNKAKYQARYLRENVFFAQRIYNNVYFVTCAI